MIYRNFITSIQLTQVELLLKLAWEIFIGMHAKCMFGLRSAGHASTKQKRGWTPTTNTNSPHVPTTNTNSPNVPTS